MKRVLFLLVVLGSSAYAQTLVYRIGTAPSVTVPTITPNYTADFISSISPLTAGIGLTAGASKTWNWNGFFSASKETAIINNDYWTWSFATSESIVLKEISFSLDRTIPGPSSFAISYDVKPIEVNNNDYYSYTELIQSSVGSSGQNYVQPFNNLSLKAGEKISFVITAWAGAGSLRLLNTDAQGDPDGGYDIYGGLSGIAVTAVIPEPSAVSLLAVGLGGWAVMRRRRS